MATAANDRSCQLGDFDAVVIGAGIVGAMIVRELSRLKGRFAIVEKEMFPGFGVSKASLSQIHLPDFCPPGSLKGKLCVNAPERFKKLAGELDVDYREVDELWLALAPAQVSLLKEAQFRGEANGAKGFELVGPQKIRELEPHITPNAVAGLRAKGLGVIHPPQWGRALVAHAVQNGVQLYLQTAVRNITRKDDGSFSIATSNGVLSAKYVINAAGLYADEIAQMTGDCDIRLILRKGTMLIFDKSVSHLARHMIFGTSGAPHSQDIAPTVHGNLIVGVHYAKTESKTDTRVSREGIRETLKLGQMLIPALSEADIITSFAGILATNTMSSEGDFYIAPSEREPHVIHIIVGAPGLSAAPGIADYVIKLLGDAGFKTAEKKTAQLRHRRWPRFESASVEQREQMVAENPKHGHILCRCEQVTEAEIREAIRSGASTMDAVKHLTRAGMGRCQGGFCGTFVLEQLIKQLGIAPAEVTKNGPGSYQISKVMNS